MLGDQSGGGHANRCSNERMGQRAICLRQIAQLGRCSSGRETWEITEMSRVARKAGVDLARKTTADVRVIILTAADTE